MINNQWRTDLLRRNRDPALRENPGSASQVKRVQLYVPGSLNNLDRLPLQSVLNEQ